MSRARNDLDKKYECSWKEAPSRIRNEQKRKKKRIRSEDGDLYYASSMERTQK